MSGKHFDIASWKIENFSCWNQAVHGLYIESPQMRFIERDLTMKLYMRGVSGQGDHMVVHLIQRRQDREVSGELSFMVADGSTLFTQPVPFKVDESYLQLPPGPKFEKVIRKSKENKSDLKDQFTLRLQITSDKYDENHVRSVIEVFDVTVEVDPIIILEENINILTLRYAFNNCDITFILLTCEMRKDEKIKLYLEPNKTDKLLVQTHLSLISSVGSLLRYENNKHVFKGEEHWAFSKCLTKRELSENVKTIILHLKIFSGRVSHTVKNVFTDHDGIKILPERYVNVCQEESLKTQDITTYKDKENNSVGILLKELKCLYQDHDFSDLQVKCGDVYFPVHRNILSARSAVFRAMLSTDMAEAASGCVDIRDLDPSTLSRFLAFLYTGAVEKLEGEIALKLYFAADKYLVPSLKRECVRFLSAIVSISNVCGVLSFGDEHQDPELTAAAHDFILRNFNEVLKSKEWSSFICIEPLLAVKTVTHFAVKDMVGNLNQL